jgi:1-acyl-sn-glycerol-3-phosphate acyltransferase
VLSDPLQPLLDALENGDSIIIFPEGTRGYEELPQRFKSGLYNLALKFPQVVLIPAWINNIQRLLPKGEVVPVPVLCSVTFGAPMQVHIRGAGEEKYVEDHAVFAERARDAVIALREI